MSDKKPNMAEITVDYAQFQIYGIIAWIEANGYKPHLLINTKFPGVVLPPQCMVKDTEVINVHSKACGKQQWEDDRFKVNSRFGGRDFALTIPYHSILAINFAGTENWIPMPWTQLVNAQGNEAVQVHATAVEEELGPAADQMVAASVDAKPVERENIGNVVHAQFGKPRDKK